VFEEIQDMQGEIFDIEDNEEPGWDLFGFDDDSDLEAFSLECAFGPND
jgi:hypothetical protein